MSGDKGILWAARMLMLKGFRAASEEDKHVSLGRLQLLGQSFKVTDGLPTEMNPLIEKERAKCTFNLSALATILHGGEEAARKYRRTIDLVMADPELVGKDIRHMQREEIFAEYLRRHVLVFQKIKKLGVDDEEDQLTFRRAVMCTGLTGLSLHNLMFVPMLKLQSSEEQLAEWMPLVESFGMIGCYAQTEIGHGTYIKGLETTATFDPSTDLITLHSPTLSSTKFWVGGLGRTATHCVILAQLYSKGVHCGLQAFLLPLRDHNHLPLPGIMVGDIGPKMGLAGVDNGYMRLDHVTIPRTNMLMKDAKLHRDGSFTTASNNKLLQGSMLLARIAISKDAVSVIMMSVTIATRYSCVRVQSSLAPNKPEVQILDHKTQQHKLLPLIGLAYALKLSTPPIESWVMAVVKEPSVDNDHSKLYEAHSLSSCFKVMLTLQCALACEQCRLACGGHGFLNASNLPVLYKDLVATVTAEGEVSVLLLQAARYLLKGYSKAATGTPPATSDFSSYLWLPHDVKEAVIVDDLQSLVLALQYRARGLLGRCYRRFEAASQATDAPTAWNLCSVQLSHASTAHIESVVAWTFLQEVEKHNPSSSSSYPPTAPKSSSSTSRSSSTPLSTYRVLRDVCNLHLVYTVLKASGDLLQLGYFTSETVDQLEAYLEHLYDVIRPDAVSLVDAFEIHDRQLNSALGCYDGNVYKRLFEWAQGSTLNECQVHPAITKYLKPMREGIFAKL